MRVYYRNTMPNCTNLFDSIFDTWTNTRKIPPVDVYETDNAYVIEAEVAGYDEESISLHVDKHVLKLASEGVEDKQDKVVKEIYTPAFERSFSLPEDADEAHVTADYKNGILLITIPKIAKEEPKRIEIKINK